MTDKLEPGWYWVRWLDEPWWKWEIAHLRKLKCSRLRWNYFEDPVGRYGRSPAIIGPRLTPPEGSS